MGWRFRKSFKLFPGVRINVSPRGISTTIGASPLSVNFGPGGAHANLSIPGSGISFRQKIGGGRKAAGEEPVAPHVPVEAPSDVPFIPSGAPQIPTAAQEIRSASTYELTSGGFEALRKLLLEVIEELRSLDSELINATADWDIKNKRYERWSNGFLLKHLRKGKFAAYEQDATEAREKKEELEQQRELTRLATEIEVTPEVRPAFGRVCDAFSALAESRFIWDTLSIQGVNRVVARTAADHAITRQQVRFALGQSDMLRCEWRVPYLENANGGDLYLYPGFLFYRVSRQNFAVIDCREMSIVFELSNFIEEESVPTDASVVGQTWKYTNKNGMPDRRFSNNYPIPIAQYGRVTLQSPTGLNEQYLVSNAKVAGDFVSAWQSFRAKLPDARFGD